MPTPSLSSVTLPLSSLARHTAQQFADEQVTIHKARRAFLNTLSAWAVHDYLALLNIETDLGQGDAWNPLLRHCTDVADLVMPSIGRLECRPLVGTATDCYVPPETWWERIAYIFVQIDPSYTQATLLGFLFRVEQVEVSVHSLHSMDDLLVYLHQVRQYPTLLTGRYVLLRDWLDGRYSDDWLDPRCLLTPTRPFTFRGRLERVARNAGEESTLTGAGISRGRLIPLGGTLIPLVIEVMMVAHQRVEFCLQVFAQNGHLYVPKGLMLKLIDPEGTVVLQTQARERDDGLQLRCGGALGEIFQVSLCLGKTQVTKTFMI